MTEYPSTVDRKPDVANASVSADAPWVGHTSADVARHRSRSMLSRAPSKARSNGVQSAPPISRPASRSCVTAATAADRDFPSSADRKSMRPASIDRPAPFTRSDIARMYSW